MAKILVVDDDKNIVEVLRLLLTRHGYAVCAAYNGKEALAMARQENPDLIILDVMMPEPDGLTVSGILFQDPVMRLIPVLILSAKKANNPFELVPNIRLYMEKPFDPITMLKTIEKLLRN